MNTWRQLSPPGTSAVAIIAVSGELGRLPVRDRHSKEAGWPGPGSVRLRRLWHAGRVLDEALVVGTDAGAELHIHGGPGTRAAVVAWLEGAGFVRHDAEVAPPPSSLRHARALLSARCGPLAGLLRQLSSGHLRPGPPASRSPELLDIERCADLAAFADRLARLPVVALVGLPNAGKSTLFNALLGSERALVAPEAGTTRDTVRAVLQVRGVAVELLDTAGTAAAATADAPGDLIIHVLSAPDEPDWPHRRAQLVLRVMGQSDRRAACSGRAVSGRTGAGIRQLLDDVADALRLEVAGEADLWAPADPRLSALLADVRATRPHSGGAGRGDPDGAT